MGRNVNWNLIKAEYIAGGTSYRELCEKYGVTINVLGTRAKEENWVELRQQAADRSATKAIQKTADIAADNAATIARIKSKLLKQIENCLDEVAVNGEYRKTETSKTKKDGRNVLLTETRATKLKDLTSALKDLTGDNNGGNEIEDLSALVELLK